MHTLLGRRDALRSVEARRAPEDHEIHRSVREKSGEVRVRRAAVFAAQPLHFFQVAAIHRSNLNTRNHTRRPNVRLCDISSADEPDMHGHRMNALKHGAVRAQNFSDDSCAISLMAPTLSATEGSFHFFEFDTPGDVFYIRER